VSSASAASGHLAVHFARALGAEVLAFDPDMTKRELVLGLGASELVDAKGRSRPQPSICCS